MKRPDGMHQHRLAAKLNKNCLGNADCILLPEPPATMMA
jgi:hypothetical protein